VPVSRSFAVFPALVALLCAVASPQVQADETFFCTDGSSVTLSSDNREAMQTHPCVKAWFASNAAWRAASEDGSPRQASGAIVRYPVARALAMRSTTRRPSYANWVKTASLNAAEANARVQHDRAHTQAVRTALRFRLRR
jgi:hypothetical protein